MFLGIKAEEIKKFRFETRPMEWVEFKAFVTDPGGVQRTEEADVMTRLKKAREAALQREAASQKAQAEAIAAALKSASVQVEPADKGASAGEEGKGQYYVMGSVAKPGATPLPPGGATVLQGVVSTGIGQVDPAEVRVKVVRIHDGKPKTVVNTSLLNLLNGEPAAGEKLENGDIVWLTDISLFQASEKATEEEIQNLRDKVNDAKEQLKSAEGKPGVDVPQMKNYLKSQQEQLDRAMGQLQQLRARMAE